MKKNYKNEMIMFLRDLYQKYNDDKNVLYITLILEFIQDHYPGEEKISIDVLNLSKRHSNILKRHGIQDISNLIEYDEYDLIRFYGISFDGAKLIMKKLDQYLNGDCECYF